MGPADPHPRREGCGCESDATRIRGIERQVERSNVVAPSFTLTTTTAWPARSSTAALATGAVHFWCANLDSLLGGVTTFRSQLAPDELARASRFHFERDAARYMVCRGILRRLLASYLGCDPRDVAFRYGAHGKPALVGPPGKADGDVRFNVAHTGGFALIGFARRIELGVDVERVHEIPDLDSVMRTAFARGERDRISALPSPTARRDSFFRCWTRKEAVLKALGWGLAKPLDSFEVEFEEDRPRLLSMADEERAPELWQIMHLLPASGFVGAAAWVGDELAAACFTYEP